MKRTRAPSCRVFSIRCQVEKEHIIIDLPGEQRDKPTKCPDLLDKRKAANYLANLRDTRQEQSQSPKDLSPDSAMPSGDQHEIYNRCLHRLDRARQKIPLLFRWKTNKRSQLVAKTNPCLLIDMLPAELVLGIVEHLNLSDTYHVSCTCRALRQLTHRDWEEAVMLLPPCERVDFWYALSAPLPDRWVCLECCKLRRIDLGDTPHSLKKSTRIKSLKKCGHGQGDLCPIRSYRLQSRHVELAFKYSAGQHKRIHQRYLESLLAPYTLRLMFPGTFGGDLRIQPRIARGRYILHLEWSLQLFTHDSSVATALQRFIKPCWHLTGSRDWNCTLYSRPPAVLQRVLPSTSAEQSRSVPFSALFLLGLVCSEYEIYGHCQMCATDISMFVDPTNSTLVFRTWSDLGSRSPNWDAAWLSSGLGGLPAVHSHMGHIVNSARNLYMHSQG